MNDLPNQVEHDQHKYRDPANPLQGDYAAIDPLRQENAHLNEPPGPMQGEEDREDFPMAFTDFMSETRRAGITKGPYNPILTGEQRGYFLYLQDELDKGFIPLGVFSLAESHVGNFRRIYGFDIPSQVALLNARKGEEWSEAVDLALGTQLQDMTILATDEMPDDSFYLIHKVHVVNGPTVLKHYVVLIPPNNEKGGENKQE